MRINQVELPGEKIASLCPECDYPYRVYYPDGLEHPVNEKCWECELMGEWAEHGHIKVDTNVHETLAYSCPHGRGWDELCKRCGYVVGGWGIGAAGFGELCGCADG